MRPVSIIGIGSTPAAAPGRAGGAHALGQGYPIFAPAPA